MVEHIHQSSHGIEITINPDGSGNIIGFGHGFASPINMHQKDSWWPWGSFKLNRAPSIDRSADCNDIAEIIISAVNRIENTIIYEFASRFIECYPMHGKKICAETHFEFD